MTNRAGYQPLSQSAEEDIGEGIQQPVATSPTSRGAQDQRQRQRGRPGHIDLSKLDAAFKRLANPT
jgi:phosphatidylinositol 4-kinase type 2